MAVVAEVVAAKAAKAVKAAASAESRACVLLVVILLFLRQRREYPMAAEVARVLRLQQKPRQQHPPRQGGRNVGENGRGGTWKPTIKRCKNFIETLKRSAPRA